MNVRAEIEFKDGHKEEIVFDSSSAYFSYIHKNALDTFCRKITDESQIIKIASTDDIER